MARSLHTTAIRAEQETYSSTEKMLVHHMIKAIIVMKCTVAVCFLCDDSLPSTFIYLFLDQHLALNDPRPASVTHDSNVSPMASPSFPTPPVTADRSSAPRSASRLRRAPNRVPKFRIIQYDHEKHLSRARNRRARRKLKQVREPAQVRKYSPLVVSPFSPFDAIVN